MKVLHSDNSVATPAVPSVTNGPIAGSTKIYRRIDGMGVPFRRVNLSNGEHLDLYDTSGPYTDADAVIDLHKGLPPRTGVVRDRGTQLATCPERRDHRRDGIHRRARGGNPPNWSATRWPAAGRSSRPTTTTPRPSR